MPKRIQRKRTRGWKAPEGAVYCGRGSPYGNPVVAKVGEWLSTTGGTQIQINGKAIMPLTKADAKRWATEAFRIILDNHDMREALGYPADVSPLKGRDLMCWCAEDEPHCHLIPLMEVANA